MTKNKRSDNLSILIINSLQPLTLSMLTRKKYNKYGKELHKFKKESYLDSQSTNPIKFELYTEE